MPNDFRVGSECVNSGTPLLELCRQRRDHARGPGAGGAPGWHLSNVDGLVCWRARVPVLLAGELDERGTRWAVEGRRRAKQTPRQDDRMRPLTPAEREWKETIYQRLLKVLDLSLLASAEDKDARRQIRRSARPCWPKSAHR